MDKKIFDILNNFYIGIDEKYLIDRLFDRYRWPLFYTNGQPSVEAINKDGSKILDLFLEDLYLDSNKTISLYNEGFTLIISRVEYLNSDILQMHNIISDYVGNPVNANIYFGKGNTGVSFSSHAHEYDVFVKNVAGSSKWILGNQTRTLSGQDALFFSAGTFHEVIEIHEPKISITWNLLKNSN